MKISIEEYEAKRPDKIKILVYGESGTGKTRFASTFPKPIFLDVEEGLASVVKKVDRIRIESTDAIDPILDFLRDSDYETLVVDSLTALQQLSLQDTVLGYDAKRPYNALPVQSDYFKTSLDLDYWIRKIIRLPMHVVLTAHVSPKSYEVEAVQPAFIGKQTAKKICALMDIVAYTTKVFSQDEISYLMYLSYPDFVTKFRFGELDGYYITDPSFEKLIQTIERSVK